MRRNKKNEKRTRKCGREGKGKEKIKRNKEEGRTEDEEKTRKGRA